MVDNGNGLKFKRYQCEIMVYKGFDKCFYSTGEN